MRSSPLVFGGRNLSASRREPFALLDRSTTQEGYARIFRGESIEVRDGKKLEARE
jgi:hypothetical protein